MTDIALTESRKLSKNQKLAERQKLAGTYRKAVKERRDELRALYPELMREIDEHFRAGSMTTLAGLTERVLAEL